MMRKSIGLGFGCLMLLNLKAQEFSVATVEYKQTKTEVETLSSINLLYFDQEKSCYKWLPEEEEGTQMEYYCYDKASEQLNLTAFFSSEPYLDREKPFVFTENKKFEWVLQKETKKIGDYTAIRATGKFRGHTYEAWYTLDLPYGYGPWKANGLPGLILELKETEGLYHAVASKISLNKGAKDLDKILVEMGTLEKKTQKEYYLSVEETCEEMISQMIAQLPEGTPAPNPKHIYCSFRSALQSYPEYGQKKPNSFEKKMRAKTKQ